MAKGIANDGVEKKTVSGEASALRKVMAERQVLLADAPFYKRWNFNPLHYAAPVQILPWVVPAILGVAIVSAGVSLSLPVLAGVGLSIAASDYWAAKNAGATIEKKYESYIKASDRLQSVAERLFKAAALPFKPDVRLDASEEGAFVCRGGFTGPAKDRVIIIVEAGMEDKFTDREIAAIFAHETAHVINRDTAPYNLNRRLARGALWMGLVAAAPVSLPAAAAAFVTNIFIKRLAGHFDEDRADHNSLGLFPDREALKQGIAKLTDCVEGKGYFSDCEGKYSRAKAAVADAVIAGYEFLSDHTPTGHRYKLINRQYDLTRQFYDANGLNMKDACDAVMLGDSFQRSATEPPPIKESSVDGDICGRMAATTYNNPPALKTI